MNTPQLIQQHEDQYKFFYMKNTTVISLPYLITWTGQGTKHSVNIKQKIPLRLYIGCTRSEQQGIELDSISYLSQEQNKFITNNLNNFLAYSKKLKLALNKNYGEYFKEHGIKISILSETNPVFGLDFRSLLITGISIIMNKFYHHNNLKHTIKNIVEDINTKEGNSGGVIVNEVITHAMRLLGEINGQNSDDIYDNVASIISGGLPIVFIDKKLTKFISRTDSYLPLDYIVAYSGELTENINEYSHPIKNDLQEDFYSVFDKDDLVKRSMIDISGADIINAPLLVTTMINTMVYTSLNDMYLKVKGSVTKFLDYLSRLRLNNYVNYDGNQKFINIIGKVSLKYVKRNEKIAIFSHDKFISGGSFTIAAKLHKLRGWINETFSSLKEEHPASQLIYTSREDGIEEEGIRIEHDINSQIYSNSLRGSEMAYCIGSDIIQIGDYKDLMFIISQNPPEILLDDEIKKVLINGHPVTSNEINSQSSTVDILKILLENEGKLVQNKELPSSSYSKSIGSMRGKIIAPLQKLVKDYTGKDLKITCSGPLNDFTIMLKKSDVSIGLLKNIK